MAAYTKLPSAARPQGWLFVSISGLTMLPFWFMTVSVALPVLATQTLPSASKSKPRGWFKGTGGRVLPEMRETVLSA
ncbi:hypothetical protein D3C78_1746670 [compost metagenome]